MVEILEAPVVEAEEVEVVEVVEVRKYWYKALLVEMEADEVVRLQ